MSLRNQPYLPLYVQDFLTDEKLIECSAKSTGVYIRIMCILHKSDKYGCILLKQKDKQTDSNIKNFALKLAKQMPYDLSEIEESLIELLDEKVLILEEDMLFQKRMKNDGIISDKRSEAGKKGVNKKNAKDFAKANTQAKAEANDPANSENENATENEIEIDNNINLFNYVEKNFGRTISPTEVSRVFEWQNDFKFNEDIIKYAFEKAILNDKKNFSYVEAILKNWFDKHFKTLKECKSETKQKKAEMKPDWFNKKIESKVLNDEEIKELEEMMKESE